jgi:tyrosine-protein kinase Fer
MGYSAFQEKGIQEALITRHENEFRLIETIKRCLSHRVKCDRDYAASLTNNVSQIGLKVERIEELNGKFYNDSNLNFLKRSKMKNYFKRKSNIQNMEENYGRN